VTGDRRVTSGDILRIPRQMFRRYDARYDLNGNGKVNAQDVLIAIRQIRRHCRR
jgi:hypothetical protein